MGHLRSILFVLIASGALMGCENTESEHTAESSFFKVWTGSTSGRQLDIGLGHFGSHSVTYLINGKTCTCQLRVNGFIKYGDLSIDLCALNGISSDLDCDELNQDYEYEFYGTSIELCEVPAGTCEQYY